MSIKLNVAPCISAVGREMHHYRRGHRLESRSCLKLFSGFLLVASYAKLHTYLQWPLTYLFFHPLFKVRFLHTYMQLEPTPIFSFMYKGNVLLTLQIFHRGLFFITDDQSNRVFGLAYLPWVSKYQSCHGG